jgi:hypothetical protein
MCSTSTSSVANWPGRSRLSGFGTVRVRDPGLEQEPPAVGVERWRDEVDLAREALVRKGRDRQLDAHARAGEANRGLGQREQQLQAIDLVDLHQVGDVADAVPGRHLARADGPVERSADLRAIQVYAREVNARLGGFELGHGAVELGSCRNLALGELLRAAVDVAGECPQRRSARCSSSRKRNST